MLKVECEACKAPYQVDERRVPPTGLKMRCPKCGHSFVVAHPNAPAPPPPQAAAPPPQAPPRPGAPPAPPAKMPPKKMTSVGLGTAPAAPPGDADNDPFANLPVSRPAAPGFRPPPRPAAPSGAQAPAPTLGGIDELTDLPAMPEEAGLPTAAARPAKPAFGGPAAAPRKPLPPSLADFEIDLPSADEDLLPAAKPAAKKGMTFDVDLPSPVADLPTSKGGGRRDHADLPAVSAGLPAVAAGLPAVAPGLPTAKTKMGFGEIDLPSLGGNLPASTSRDHNLPATSTSVGLPLPVVGGGLPVVSGSGLPVPQRGGRDLPEVVNSLPEVANALPQVANSLPAFAGKADAGETDFGELKLTSMPPISMDDAVEELDLPPASRDPQHAARATGGAGFGEVDLGGDPGDAVATEDVPRAEKVGGGEVALPTSPATGKRREKPADEGPPSKLPKIVLAAVGAIALGGAVLALTPYGAFGHVAISDSLHEGSWANLADDAAKKARVAMAADVADQTQKALDELVSLHADSPRARPVTAYAALAEYEAALRFGRDATRAARAQQWLGELTTAKGAKAAEIRYFSVALAAQAASGGDFAAARSSLEQASKKDVGDPIQQDIALTRGELELASGDPAAAATAFTKAVQLAPTARTHFGLARAYALGEDVTKARAELATTLASSAHHAGALVLRAALAWSTDKNESAAMSDLQQVFEGAAKSAASPGDMSKANALLGWIRAGKGKPSEARDAFDQALKLDSRNVDALVGQGEALYTEGRTTEALSRFDTAVQIEPKNIRAIVSDAKAKIALERLADAKTQLTAARLTFPGEMRIAYWVAKVEAALGNKKAAEDAYLQAIALANPAKPEAIDPYVGMAEMLAHAGRATEAQAKLDEAKSKLPDSTAMQRALGEVAAVQGNYDEAVAHYQAAVQKDPGDLSSHFLLGETYIKMGRFDLAGGELDKVLAADKDYPGLAMQRGVLFEKSGQIEKALEQFEAALKKAPDEVDLKLRVGAAYVGVGRADEALAIMKQVMEKRGMSAEANYYYGRAYFLKGGTALVDATRYLKQAVRLNPNEADYHFYLAWVATELPTADIATAKLEADQALALNKLMGGAYWQKAVVELFSNAVDDAIKDVKKSLQLEPTRLAAHATLAECYDAKSQHPAAMAEWQKAIDGNDPQHMAFWRYSYGKDLFDKGNIAQAFPHLAFAVTEAAKMSPTPAWSTGAEFMAAEAYRKAGQKNDAVDHYNRFLDAAPPTNPDRKAALNALIALGHPRER